MNVSILILTLNEEVNLPRCLASVGWSDDIVVLDSFSSDQTEGIARAANVRFIQRKFDNWSSHQNWAVQNIEFRHPWVYYSDADEVMPAELVNEVCQVTSGPDVREVLFRVRFKAMFMGTWIKRSSLYPTWVARLFRPNRVHWERETNPIAVADGPEGKLREHFLHFSFNKGMTHWFDKHNSYSSYEASETIKAKKTISLDIRGLESCDPVRRRRALKELSFRLPARPVVKFVYMYLVRFGFLDGRAGLTYCLLQAIYEYMICLKVREEFRRERGLPV